VTEREQSTTVTDPADIDPCPGCGGTSSAADHRHLTPGSGVVTHGVPDELGEHRRQGAAVL
jgi:hypothetical protein